MKLQATIVFKKNWNAIHAKNEDGSRKYRYIINKGSSRSSKTLSLIDCYDLYARANNDKRLTVWRDHKTDCKKTVLNDALKHLKRTGRFMSAQDFNKTESIFTYDTGSTFEIHGTDDEETVHGLQQDVAWLNEPYKISKETFDQIDQRTSDFIFIDWNPKKSHWVENLELNPRAIVINSTFLDNPFCPPEQRLKILSYQTIKQSKIVAEKYLREDEARIYDFASNPRGFSEKMMKELRRCRENEFQRTADAFNWSVYGLGEKADKPHRIFRWEEIPDDVFFNLDAKSYIGVDWGSVDPWGIVRVKYYDGALYLHEINYTSETDMRRQLSTTELKQISGEDEGIVKFMFKKLAIDSNWEIICDSNRPLKIAHLRHSGWPYTYPAMKVPGSILDGIDLLNNIRVYFTASSSNIRHEQENYSRKKVDNIVMEEPEDIDNHLMDAVRYVAMYLQRLGVIRRL